MIRARFSAALRETKAGDWERFEHLASSFLAADYPDLRTTASPSGDQGRDGTLFGPSGDNSIMFQYSVTSYWEEKIKSTAKRLSANFQDVQVLVYVTNQEIGSRGDKLKVEIQREHRIFLDIRDQSWFLDRVNRDFATEAAAEELASVILDPLLAKDELIPSRAQALDSIEARTALVFLELQWEDVTREKGLTRLSYEALVLAALRHTNSHERLAREAIHQNVAAVVPSHPSQTVKDYTNAALKRLSKKRIRHWKSEDTFCLTHQESMRVQEKLLEVDEADQRLQDEVQSVVNKLAAPEWGDCELNDIATRSRQVLESFLLEQGEEFVAAVLSDTYDRVKTTGLRDRVIDHLNQNPLPASDRRPEIVDIIEGAVRTILVDPGIAIRQHLRPLADSYTLLAFLRATPDVQTAVGKLFASGDIWLDTSLLLPLFAETLLSEEENQFSTVIKAAVEAGLRLHVTSGVLEEVVAHMHLCIKFMQIMSSGTEHWEGRTPYLCARYIATGRSTGAFARWLEMFRGEIRPEDDVADYLRSTFSIDRFDLEEAVDAAPADLRSEAQEEWYAITEDRRLRRGSRLDSIKAARLARHDIENYLGVLQRRRGERDSPMGYASWWVTLDSATRSVDRRLRSGVAANGFVTPVMSPDFLVNYLAVGPSRGKVSKETEKSLPTVFDLRLVEAFPPELLVIANAVREQNRDLPEHAIRRKVRDALDSAKSREGRISIEGVEALEDLVLNIFD